MSLTVTEVRELALQAMAGGSDPFRPPVEAADVVAHLDDPDRNVRVAALRVLARLDGPEASAGILRGLDDPIKRVREVAAKSSVRFTRDPRVVDRLRRAAEGNEPGSARPALQVLLGVYTSPYGLRSMAPVETALSGLSKLPKYRQQALVALLRCKVLTDETTALLRYFVNSGSKDEAVAATRRLCGRRLVRREELTDEERRAAERAWSNLWYWVRTE